MKLLGNPGGMLHNAGLSWEQAGYGMTPVKLTRTHAISPPFYSGGGKFKLPTYQQMIAQPSPAVNNWKPGSGIPEPIAMYGGGSRAGKIPTYQQMIAQPSPAVNNWKPGTRIPEPVAMYQFQASPSKPIPIRQRSVNHSILSSDDFKPMSETQKYYGVEQFMPGKATRVSPIANPVVKL
jgi:hypothetical protein